VKFHPIRWRSLLALLVGLAACTTTPSKPPTPLQLAGMRASSIVVAPFNIALPLPPELRSSTRLVSEALIEYLDEREKGPQLLESDVGEALWTASTNEVVRSGGDKNFETAARVFARMIGERTTFDAIIFPSLYIQNANTNFKLARWDGATQRVEFKGRSRQEIEMPEATTIPAASLLIYVLDTEGNTIHSKRTGVELIQHLELRVEKKQGYDQRVWTLKDDDPPIENESGVRAAIVHSLYPYLPK
jgi:hypothetical protein